MRRLSATRRPSSAGSLKKISRASPPAYGASARPFFSAPTATAAAGLAARRRPELIVVDLRLPDASAALAGANWSCVGRKPAHDNRDIVALKRSTKRIYFGEQNLSYVRLRRVAMF
jgi:hypothetical protein